MTKKIDGDIQNLSKGVLGIDAVRKIIIVNITFQLIAILLEMCVIIKSDSRSIRIASWMSHALVIGINLIIISYFLTKGPMNIISYLLLVTSILHS